MDARGLLFAWGLNANGQVAAPLLLIIPKHRRCPRGVARVLPRRRYASCCSHQLGLGDTRERCSPTKVDALERCAVSPVVSSPPSPPSQSRAYTSPRAVAGGERRGVRRQPNLVSRRPVPL